ncbi:MAG: type VI secretion system-associated protein TagF [Gammaproteobacteria bacterium]|nr:type VI secretion system-associated protein TagF [Gammaproteobacteria bacterium]
MSTPVMTAPLGYYGKLPARGDFLGDRLPPELQGVWGDWLQSVVAVSREQLEGRWLDYYLAAPIWHFAISAGVCGDSGCAGVLLPSVDSVGRHFPFSVLTPVTLAPTLMQHQQPWYDSVEVQALAVLDEGFSLPDWLQGLSQPQALPTITPTNWRQPGGNRRRLAIVGDSAKVDHSTLLDHLLRQQYGGYSLWWTRGSDDLPPSTLVVEGLPPVGMFAAMMDGDWERPCS